MSGEMGDTGLEPVTSSVSCALEENPKDAEFVRNITLFALLASENHCVLLTLIALYFRKFRYGACAKTEDSVFGLNAECLPISHVGLAMLLKKSASLAWIQSKEL
jgi:hypothetical protein